VKYKHILLTATIALGTLGLQACSEEDDSITRAQDSVREAADDTAEFARDAADATGDAIRDTGDAISDAARDAGDHLEDACEDVTNSDCDPLDQ
jgi:hypothetical protein